MSDSIEIESGGRVLRGTGNLSVSTTLFRIEAGGIERPVTPCIKGYVVFENKPTHKDLMDITNGRATCAKAAERPVVFVGATMMSAEPGAHANGYSINIMGTPLPD